MSAGGISGLHCEIWQPRDFAETDACSSLRPPEFFIDLYVSIYATHGVETVSRIRYKSFRRRCDVLTQEGFSWSAISSMLSEINVPYHLQPFFIQQISAGARGIAGEPDNALLRTIPMVVELRMPEEESESQTVSGLTRASRLPSGVCGVSSGECVICLDEICVGCEAVRMPCSHVYHRICIVKWLEQRNVCPLCRFQMPLEEQEQEEQ